MKSLAACELNGVLKRGFAKDYLRPGAPNLHLGDVLNVGRQRNASVDFVALDAELLQLVGVSFGINDLPVRIRGSRHLEIVRERQHVFSVNNSVSDGSGVGLGSGEFGAGVAFVSENAGRS